MFTASWHPYTLYFKRPAGTSRGVLRTHQTYFIRLASNEAPSQVGWGECGPVKGLSVDDRAKLSTKLEEVCVQFNHAQVLFPLEDWPAVAFAFEMAQRDLEQGGRQMLFDTPFSRGEASLATHGLIWMADREGVLKQVFDKVALGFRCIKMKIGALPFEEECAILSDIRAHFPPEQIELRLDANGAFTPQEALSRLEALAPFGIRFLEQPIKPRQWSEMAYLCARSPIPIALDEELIGYSDARQRQTLLDAICPQHLILKPTLLGGFAASESWMALAEERGIEWWINSSLESNVGLNAICQWLSKHDPERIHALGTGQLYTNNIPSPIALEGAHLRHDLGRAWIFWSTDIISV